MFMNAMTLHEVFCMGLVFITMLIGTLLFDRAMSNHMDDKGKK